ncbi:zinc-dependent metalloprotease [Nesterenkonia aerolata]|uniref:Zinc-dependent metalloprotease n=1 Tax=Nesterenkonia aerolata TaxID=3074079 RepID=A0ABU2DNP6_9MICC|nr:zinc-dependent metalloprotease [Nesterenkonia sp. LY-0111]MDR8018142.1 zinc-dependent metalloprotease [Nesterenkonia sp. LY-0111]
MNAENSDRHDGEGREDGHDPNQDAMEEMFRKLFGQGDDAPGGESSSDESTTGDSRGPSMGFTGRPGSNSGGSPQGQGGFPPMPEGFDPTQMGLPPMDPQMMQQIMGQVQSMFTAMQSSSEEDRRGPVNWTMAKQAARQAAAGDDPSVSPAESREIDEALRLADMWLDAATTFESTGQLGRAWSRAQWVEETFDAWKQLTEPVAESISEALSKAMKDQLGDGDALSGGLPPELQAMMGGAGAEQLTGMLEQMGGVAFGMQLGQAVGELSKEVHSSSDIGLPLAGKNTMALLPKNITEFGHGLQVERREVLLYLALREAARMRLFSQSPWLEGDLFSAVAQYAAGIHIDTQRIEEAASQVDPSNPESMQQAMQQGLFSPERTPMQEAALRRIETTLALVEGWVDDVVSQAAEHLESLAALRETMNRRRATGGPAEHAFAGLVGLELRPRRLRDAAALWAHLRETLGVSGRDEVWSHPDVQPEEQDLDDPQGFQARRAEREAESAKFEEELQKLLDGGYHGGEGSESEADDASESGPDGDSGGDSDRS